MSISLIGKDFLKIADFSKEELIYLLDVAANLKLAKQQGKIRYLEGKKFALIFEKDFTRTRCAFEGQL